MQRTIHGHRFFSLIAALILTLSLFLFAHGNGDKPDLTTQENSTTSSYIVQATSAAAAKVIVTRAGGKVTAILNIIDAVGADLSDAQVEWLRMQSEDIRIFRDGTLNVSGAVAETHYPTIIGAATLHEQGLTGQGVTVAVLDTGLWKTRATEFNSAGNNRILAQYDATLPSWYDDDCDDDDDCDGNGDDDDNDCDGDDDCDCCSSTNNYDLDDWNGHGTHITSIMVSSDRTEARNYQGVAPDASVVAVRAFEPNGMGTYLNVIKALDWIVSHKHQYNIQILNLSFGAPAASHYWDDPVNQAVMSAWRSGIIVVAAAGNSGPGPMTIGVPGNVPYVITVGAMTDHFTPYDLSDDRLTTFSAAGPTYEGFVKPDLVAPGGHMLGQMPPYAWLPLEHPNAVLPVNDYFSMSGTSQATAVVSGVLALILQAEPGLSPDAAKCRLIASAKAALRNDGTYAYSVFQQGAGLVDAVAAIDTTIVNCANQGLNIAKDLAGWRHYAGPAGVDENGTYYLVDGDGNRLSGSAYQWSQGALWPEGATWNQDGLWNQGGLWPEGGLWPQGGLWGQGGLWLQGGLWGQGGLWPEGGLWNQGVVWKNASSLNPDSLLNQGALWPEGWNQGLTQPTSINLWVEAE